MTAGVHELWRRAAGQLRRWLRGWQVQFAFITACFIAVVALRLPGWDVPPFDGAYYFEAARSYTLSTPLARAFSPLYVATYALFQRVVPFHLPWDVCSAFRILMLYGAVCLFWSVTRRVFAAPAAATLTLMVMASDAILGDFHVVHVAALAYALAILRITLMGENWQVLALTLTVVGTAIRPEFALACVAEAGAMGYQWLHRRLPRPTRWPLVASGVVAALFATFWLGCTRTGEDRSFLAFAQWSAWQHYRDAGVEPAMVLAVDSGRYIRGLYPGARSIAEAAVVNTRAFAQHIGRGLLALPTELLKTVTPFREDVPLFGDRSETGGNGSLRALTATVLLAAAVTVGLGAPRTPVGWHFWLVAMSFAGSAMLASVVVTRPNGWHLLPAVPAVVLGLSSGAARAAARIRERTSAAASELIRTSALGLALAGLVAGHAVSGPTLGRPMRANLEFLDREYARLAPIRVLGFGSDSYCIYLRAMSRPECVPFGTWSGPVDRFLQDQRINVVVLSSPLLGTHGLTARAGDSPAASALHGAGFRRVQYARGRLWDEALYVRGGSMAGSAPGPSAGSTDAIGFQGGEHAASTK